MKSRIPLEELAKLPSFYMPQFSWGRDKVAFYSDKSGRLELYVMDLPERTVRQISHGELPRSPRAGFVWDRQDAFIIFAKDRQGDEQHDLYRIEIGTGEVTQLTRDPECQEYPVEISPDNEWVAITSNRFGQLNVSKLQLTDPGELVELTRFANPAQGVSWSPDGAWLAVVSNESTDLRNSDVYLVKADGGEIKKVSSVGEGSRDFVSAWSPDGQYLAFSSDVSGVNQAGLLQVETGEIRWLSPAGTNETAQEFSQNGRYLVCLRNENAEVQPVIYDLENGSARTLKLPSGLGFSSSFTADDQKLLLSFGTATRRTELILYDLADDSWETLLPAEYGSIDPEIFVPSEHIWYPSYDGRSIPALLHVPPEIPAGEKRPAIVIVHGGPTAQFFQSFDPYAQFLVAQGYVVLKPNIRGSTGYGVEFRDLNRFDWGGGDLEDVAAGAAYLKRLSFVDPQRLGVFGGSYGGYMTFMQVVKKPELWRAASAAVGISDIRQLYEDSMAHFKYYLRQQMGDPEENADLWQERSALNFVGNMRAKLQIMHGVNDPRCPINQSRLFRDKLLENGFVEGQDFQYIEFDDQGHGSADIDHKIRWYTLLADFMAEALQ